MPNAPLSRWRFPALLACACALLVSAAHARDPGTELAQQVYDRPDGRDQSVRLRMTLTEPGHAPRNRLFYSYRLDEGGGQVRSLARFLEPADVAGTGLLTLDEPDEETAQWLYLPALKRERRISGSRKGGRFVGSDLYFEDLRDRPVARDRHRITGEDEVMGVACEVLESVPVAADNSVYDRRESCIHRETLLPLRIDYFEGGKGRPSKRLTVSRIKRIQGFWTVMESRVTDLASGHETRLAVEGVAYDQGLPATLFSIQALTDPSRDVPYRP